MSIVFIYLVENKLIKMTNIFNKNVLARNGTLIGNWFEEEVLREKTGEGR